MTCFLFSIILSQEHHLQRALSARQVYGTSDALVIPIPEVQEMDARYKELYTADYKTSKQYIHIQGKSTQVSILNDCILVILFGTVLFYFIYSAIIVLFHVFYSYSIQHGPRNTRLWYGQWRWNLFEWAEQENGNDMLEVRADDGQAWKGQWTAGSIK